ncbi:hypothetical protein BDW62DRAFT_201804 [Aspergillus aurantiobrunneus]
MATPTSTAPPVPLTTTFVPPYECLNDFWILKSAWTGTNSFWANLGPDDPEACLPSGWATETYFSPGIACPSGPSSWTFSPRTSGGDWQSWHSIEVCVYDPTSDISFAQTNTNDDSASKEIAPGSMTAGQPGFNAYGVELHWKASDRTTAAPTPTPTEGSPDEASSGLSTGGKAGVGVGAAVGGILVILALGFFIWRGRKPAAKGVDSDSSPPYYEPWQRHELNTAGSPGPRKEELDSNPVFEAEGYRAHPQSREPAEME